MDGYGYATHCTPDTCVHDEDETPRSYMVIEGNAYALHRGCVISTAMQIDGTPDHETWTEPAYGQISQGSTDDLNRIESLLNQMPTVVSDP